MTVSEKKKWENTVGRNRKRGGGKWGGTGAIRYQFIEEGKKDQEYDVLL